MSAGMKIEARARRSPGHIRLQLRLEAPYVEVFVGPRTSLDLLVGLLTEPSAPMRCEEPAPREASAPAAKVIDGLELGWVTPQEDCAHS